jgi:hypothetical protein
MQSLPLQSGPVQGFLMDLPNPLGGFLENLFE